MENERIDTNTEEFPEEEIEKVDVEILTAAALELYEKYIPQGAEIPEQELATLRSQVKSLPEEDFRHFRIDIGSLAWTGKAVIQDKDVGEDLMRIIFGPQDAKNFGNVKTLTNILKLGLRDYNLTNILRLYETAGDILRGSGISGLSQDEVNETRRAHRELGVFLMVVSGAGMKQRVLLDREQSGLLKSGQNFESALLSPKDSKELRELKVELKEKLVVVREEIASAWKAFKIADFESAPFYASHLCKLIGAEESLRKEIRTSGDTGETQEMSDSYHKSLIKASVLQAIAKELNSDAEERRAYDERAAKALRRKAAKIGDKDPRKKERLLERAQIISGRVPALEKMAQDYEETAAALIANDSSKGDAK